MARHTTQNGHNCCDNHSSFTSTAHEGYHVPCSKSIARIARRRGGHRRRRIGSPYGSPCNSTGSLTDPQPRGQPEPNLLKDKNGAIPCEEGTIPPVLRGLPESRAAGATGSESPEGETPGSAAHHQLCDPGHVGIRTRWYKFPIRSREHLADLDNRRGAEEGRSECGNTHSVAPPLHPLTPDHWARDQMWW